MAAFSLQRLLELKKRREEMMGAELAAARAAEERARRSESEIRELRAAAAHGRLGGHTVTVGQLQNSSLVVESLDRQLDQASEEVRAARRRVNDCLLDFRTAFQERRVLDRLKEKKMEEAATEEIRLDQSTMDEIALTRFGRNETETSRGES